MKKYNIELNEKELKLLMLILNEAEDDRSSMSCNDPYKKEEKIFTKEERIVFQRKLYGKQLCEEDEDGFLFNDEYVQIIIDIIKSQTKK